MQLQLHFYVNINSRRTKLQRIACSFNSKIKIVKDILQTLPPMPTLCWLWVCIPPCHVSLQNSPLSKNLKTLSIGRFQIHSVILQTFTSSCQTASSLNKVPKIQVEAKQVRPVDLLILLLPLHLSCVCSHLQTLRVLRTNFLQLRFSVLE